MSITTILFDLGNVFVDINFDSSNEEFGRRAGTSADVAKRRINGERYHEFCRGEMTCLDWHAYVQRVYGFEMPYDQFARQWADVFSPIDGMFGLARRTRASCRQYLLSNTDPLHLPWCMERFPFDGLLDGLILSYEAGAMKPDPRIYEYGVERFDIVPGESVFIDDRQVNVEGAEAFGITGIVCESPQQVERELNALGVVTT